MLAGFYLFKRIYFALITILGLFAVGVLGYMLIEDFSFFDALYMTTITVSTVGFTEIKTLSAEGRLFTIGLIISSISVFAYAVTIITTNLIEGSFTKYWSNFNLVKKLKRMENHVIVCGYGRVGRGAAEDLRLNNIPFVVIDLSVDVESVAQSDSIPFISGDASVEEVLHMAGIERARALITCLPKDPDNLYVVLSARQINQDLSIIARASRADAVTKLKLAGATNVIMPDTVGGNHMAALVTTPDLMEFLDVIRYEGHQGVNVKSFLPSELNFGCINKRLGELDTDTFFGCIIIGAKDEQGSYIVNPPNDLVITEKMRLFFLGNQDQIRNLDKIKR
jgi:voltage-gated potassium channel